MSRSLTTPSRLGAFRTRFAILLSALLVAVSPQPAAAVNINVSYDETDRPSFDPTGAKLMNMMAWVEAYYESILTDMSPQWHPTYDIEVWWEDLPDGTQRLAETQINPFEVDIVFDTKLNGVERNWFFDETPIDNSEFLFAESFGASSPFVGSGQNLFRDIVPSFSSRDTVAIRSACSKSATRPPPAAAPPRWAISIFGAPPSTRWATCSSSNPS